MNCPVCTVELKIADRQGIEIDYCPQCRGVWLDRGELDKLLDRAGTASAPSAAAVAPAPRSRQQPDFEDSDYRDRQRHPQSRKKSWLNEFFD